MCCDNTLPYSFVFVASSQSGSIVTHHAVPYSCRRLDVQPPCQPYISPSPCMRSSSVQSILPYLSPLTSGIPSITIIWTPFPPPSHAHIFATYCWCFSLYSNCHERFWLKLWARSDCNCAILLRGAVPKQNSTIYCSHRGTIVLTPRLKMNAVYICFMYVIHIFIGH